ncbi:MAG: SDR family oxidoreductase [Acholeplasmataceae bacterium]|nr:SDR family oxidoreductase [Acholeplasmataceae bacterium]
MKVNGKVIVVTGAGGGVGRELVLNLLKKGASVAAVDMDKKRLAETEKLANNKEKLSTHICNITKKDEIAIVLKEVIDKFGVVDGLINNAGIIQPFVDVKDLTDAQINKVMDVNFFGTLNMIQAFLPLLLERPEGHILNVSSMGGFFPFPGQSIYGASKAAIKLLTEGLYAELIKTNVNVTIVFPGAIATDIAKNSDVKMGAAEPKESEKPAMKMTEADDCAEQIIKGMEKNKFQIYVGKDSKMMKFMYRMSPKRAIKFISKMMAGMNQ